MDQKYLSSGFGYNHTKVDEIVARQHRGGHLDNHHKLQSENDYLRERVQACEKGITNIYQTIQRRETAAKPPTHYRSASLTYRADSLSPTSTLERGKKVESGMGMEFDDEMFPIPRMVTISELKEVIEKLVLERDNLASQVDDLKQVTEAAKRERVLAIDEKDHLLREAHILKVAVDKSEANVKVGELERRQLTNQMRGMEEEMKSLKRATDEARRMRALALEERAKLREECNQLQCELTALQDERDSTFQENMRLQNTLKEMSRDKGRLVQELDWLSKRTSGYEAVARTLKEQNTALNGQICDNLTVKLERNTATQPWGFSIEGGKGSEFYRDDPSIVVTGISEISPAYGKLRFGDRILSVNSRDFTSIARREATESLRSCDQLSIILEIGRITSHVKPLPQEVKIPGKKMFGFSSETRLFVSSVEEGSTAADLLALGDEITQVMGKSAVNMKQSHFKQIIKSCKDGLSLTIQRSSGSSANKDPTSSTSSAHLRSSSSSTSSSSTNKSRPNSKSSSSNRCSLVQQQRSSGEISQQQPQHQQQQHSNFQAPGTPGSTVSETSAGYHSLTHSMPSVASNVLSPDMKTGQTSLTEREGEEYHRAREREEGQQQQQPGGGASCESHTPRTSSLSSHHLRTSRGELAAATAANANPPPASLSSNRLRTASAGSAGVMNHGINRSSFHSRPRDLYPRRNMTLYSQRQGGLRPRTVSQTSFGTSPSGNLTSPKRPDSNGGTRFSYKGASLPHGMQPPTTPTFTTGHSAPPAPHRPVFSMSADNLDSDACFPPATPRSHDGHMSCVTTPSYSRGPFSISMGSMQTHV